MPRIEMKVFDANGGEIYQELMQWAAKTIRPVENNRNPFFPNPTIYFNLPLNQKMTKN